MCGIFGITGKHFKKFNLECSLLTHRGPDNFGSFTNNSDIYLAHNRLSIIGLDVSSNQPMRGHNETIIVFNGEIYNYKNLKKTELADYQFKSKSDTEVILALYEKHGIDCVKFLRGMFAFLK